MANGMNAGDGGSEVASLRRRVVELEAELRQARNGATRDGEPRDATTDEQYRFVADAMPQFVWVARPNGETEYVNRRWYEYSGMAPNERLHEAWPRIVHPDDLQHVAETFLQAHQRKETHEAEFRIRRASDGQYRWHLSRSTPILDGEGEIRKWIGSAFDIEDRKRAEDELRRTKSQILDILDSITESFIAVDRDFRLTYVNQRVADRVGLMREALIGRSLWDVAPAAMDSEFYSHYTKVIADRKPDRFEMFYAPTDSWYEVYAYPTEEGLSAFIADITARKRAGRALLEKDRELARLNQHLSRFNADLEQFAYAAAHDLQEPARNVQLDVQLLARSIESPTPRVARHMNSAIESARRMQDLIQDLLSYTQSIQEDEQSAVCDPVQVVQAVLADVRAAVDAADAEVLYDRLPASARMKALHLRQILYNLVSNALKYHGAARPCIRIGCREAPGEQIFSVTDNGVGIAPEHHERIFKVFKRLHGRDIPGTGIGLAICKRLVTHYGGRIWVESEGTGHGSRFRFSIPDARTAPA